MPNRRKSLSRPRKKLKNSAQFRRSRENVIKRRERHKKDNPNDKRSLMNAKDPLIQSKKRK